MKHTVVFLTFGIWQPTKLCNNSLATFITKQQVFGTPCDTVPDPNGSQWISFRIASIVSAKKIGNFGKQRMIFFMF